MKNYLKLTVFLLLSVLLTTSCKKDDTDDMDDEVALGTLSATIDGEAFSALLGTATLMNVIGDVGQSFTIQGSQTSLSLNSQTLGIAFFLPLPGEISTGTYNESGILNCGFIDPDLGIVGTCSGITYSEISTVAGTSVSYVSEYEGGNSSVSITAIDFMVDGTVKGTFSGKLEGNDESVIDITNGKFHLTIF